MILPLLGIMAGLALLTWSADQFVAGAVRVAARLNLSTVVIGALVIGFGTSAPEIVVSSLASAQGSLEIAAGNIIGSNVANLSLVLGSAALVVSLSVATKTLRREAPIAFAATVLFAILVQDGLTRTEGLIMLGTLVGALTAIVLGSIGNMDSELAGEVDEFLEDVGERTFGFEAGRTLLGLVGTVAAAQMLVVSATEIASQIGLDEGFVGLSIVAIGTSLPELATSLQAARKDETDLIIGNLLGSNLFNSLAVGGAAAMFGPATLADGNLTGLAVWLMLGITGAAALFMLTGRRVVRWEGAVLLIGYITVMPLLA